jgi:hypothetical protein
MRSPPKISGAGSNPAGATVLPIASDIKAMHLAALLLATGACRVA